MVGEGSLVLKQAAATKPRKRKQGRPPLIADAKNRILDEAAILFARNGYDNGSISEVAQRVGVTKAAIFHYYPSKQELYDALIVRTLSGLIESVGRDLKGTESPEAELRTFMLSHARYFEANYWSFVCMLIGFGGMEDPSLRSDAFRLRNEYEGMLRSIISRGIGAGVFADEDVSATGRAVLSMLNWMARWYNVDGSRSAADFALDYYNLIYKGLRRQ